jgi:hypothetical protein
VLDRKCLQSVLALDRCHSASLTPREARMCDKRLAHEQRPLR